MFLIYSRLENDPSNPDFITGNQFSRVGLCRDPLAFGSDNKLTLQKASAVYALNLLVLVQRQLRLLLTLK